MDKGYLFIVSIIHDEAKRLDLTLKEVAARSGIHRNTVQKVLSGKGPAVSLEVLRSICDGIGLSWHDLLASAFRNEGVSESDQAQVRKIARDLASFVAAWGEADEEKRDYAFEALRGIKSNSNDGPSDPLSKTNPQNSQNNELNKDEAKLLALFRQVGYPQKLAMLSAGGEPNAMQELALLEGEFAHLIDERLAAEDEENARIAAGLPPGEKAASPADARKIKQLKR